MDGYLRTLANRVLGATSDLRSTRAIRTAAPATAEAADVLGPIVPDADGEPPKHPAQPHDEGVRSSRNLPPPAAPAATAMPPGVTPGMPVTVDRSSGRPVGFHPPANAPEGQVMSVATLRSALTTSIGRAPAQRLPEPDAERHDPVPFGGAIADPAPTAAGEPRLVAGLVPARKPLSGAPGRRGPVATTMEEGNGDPAAIEVHIHIGRVELTAAPAAVARTSAAGTAKTRPMSLDAYLLQRRRRLE